MQQTQRHEEGCASAVWRIQKKSFKQQQLRDFIGIWNQSQTDNFPSVLCQARLRGSTGAHFVKLSQVSEGRGLGKSAIQGPERAAVPLLMIPNQCVNTVEM